MEIDRHERRNAIYGPTAEALRRAFLIFGADESQSVAVLAGAGEHFCVGADLSALDDPERGLRIEAPPAPGPLGCSRMRLSKPVIAGIEGYPVAGDWSSLCWAHMPVAVESARVRGLLPQVRGAAARIPAGAQRAEVGRDDHGGGALRAGAGRHGRF